RLGHGELDADDALVVGHDRREEERGLVEVLAGGDVVEVRPGARLQRLAGLTAEPALGRLPSARRPPGCEAGSGRRRGGPAGRRGGGGVGAAAPAPLFWPFPLRTGSPPRP